MELLQYHKSNAALDLMIGELKLKKEGMMKDSDEVGRQLSDAIAHRERITADVHAALKPSNGREFKVGLRDCRARGCLVHSVKFGLQFLCNVHSHCRPILRHVSWFEAWVVK